MSILIKGMKMPESCNKCPMNKDKGFDWKFESYCALTLSQTTIGDGRKENCPLQEEEEK